MACFLLWFVACVFKIVPASYFFKPFFKKILKKYFLRLNYMIKSEWNYNSFYVP